MEKIIIKVLLSSIRRNPDYCPPGTMVLLEGKRRFDVYCKKPLPKKMEVGLYCVGAEIVGGKRRDLHYCAAGPIDQGFIDMLEARKKMDPSISYEMTHSPRWVESPFSPMYLYRYQNPLLVCGDCGSRIRFRDIRTVSVPYDEYDEINADQCPNCEGINTFDYKLEKIDDAIKRGKMVI